MANNNTKNDYQPVQKTDEDDNQHPASRRKDNEDGTGQDPALLLPEERCCCSAIQCLVTPPFFCALICLCCMFYGAAFVATGGGVLSTIEKRFQLKTSELAPFLVVNDVISVLMIVFVAYYGHTSHRPRLIGGGTIIVGLGFFICAMPQFLYDTPPQFSLVVINPADNDRMEVTSQHEAIYPVCRGTNETTLEGSVTDVCTEEEEMTSGALMGQVSWIIAGQILVGIGTAPLSPLSITYIDDCMEKTSTAVFLSCIFVSGSIGPFLGYVISSFSLSKHADFYKAPVHAQEGDPNWIGAWWLCFALTGIMIIIAGVPIMLFPKSIRKRGTGVRVQEGEGSEVSPSVKDDDKMQDQTENDADSRDMKVTDQDRCVYITGFLSAFRRLVTNPPYITVTLGACASAASIVAYFSFLAKYIETQFSLAATATPLLTGIIISPGMILGSFIGGFVVKRLKLTNKGMARMLVILKPFVLLLAPALLFLGCDNRDIAGITVSYTENITDAYLVSACNSDCACSDDYAPVCGSDGMTYATPCHAGCLATSEEKQKTDGPENITVFSECSCIESGQDNTFGLNGDYEHIAVTGECGRECNTLIPFVALSIVAIMFSSIMGIPAYMLKLRTVDEDDRSIAIGFSSFLVRLLATIPSPIFFGTAIQSTCLLLQSSCGSTGNCLVYDIVQFRYVFFGLGIALEVVSTVMCVLCYALIKTPPSEGFQEVDSGRAMEAVETSGNQTGNENDSTQPHESYV